MLFELNPMFPDATIEQKWSQFRIWREAQLRLTDWTQLPDAPLTEEEKQKYRQYRDFLRNAPSVYQEVEDIEFEANIDLIGYKVNFRETKYQIKKKDSGD